LGDGNFAITIARRVPTPALLRGNVHKPKRIKVLARH
jgi:hypothetical protein